MTPGGKRPGSWHGRHAELLRAWPGLLGACAALLAACVLPSTQTSIHDLIRIVPSVGPPTTRSSSPPGADLVITRTPAPVDGTPGPEATGPAPGTPGKLVLDADLNVGGPSFAVQGLPPGFSVQALPPGFAAARYQINGPGGSRVGEMAVDAFNGRGSATVFDLAPGSYAILVVALESDGLVVASGTGSAAVPTGAAASTSVKVESAGKQRVRIDLPAGEIPTPSFTVGCQDRVREAAA